MHPDGMNFTDIDIDSLLNLFRNTKPARFIILFVGGGKKDQFFFEEVLSHAETIDLLSGKIADVYLFFDGQDDYLKIGNDRRLKGKRLGQLGSCEESWVINVREMDVPSYSGSIIRNSISVSADIICDRRRTAEGSC